MLVPFRNKTVVGIVWETDIAPDMDDSDLAGASLFVVAQRGFFRNLGGHIVGWIRIIRLVKLQQAKWENVPHSLARQRYG